MRRTRGGSSAKTPRQRRVALAALAVCVLAPAIGCGPKALGIKQFATGFVEARLNKERTLQETCEALARPDQGGTNPSALDKALDLAKKHDLGVLAKALCGEVEGASALCTANTSSLTIDIADVGRVSASGKDLLRVIASSEGKLGPGEDALASAVKIIGDAQKMERVLSTLTMARAGLFVALRLGDGAQGLADRAADSFGVFQGFARPLLERVAAEIVAVAMDRTLEIVEQRYGVPRADVSKEACLVYKRSEPRSNVAAFVLERAILRYAPPDSLATLVEKGTLSDCETLDGSIPKDPFDPPVCDTIRRELVAAEEPLAPGIAPDRSSQSSSPPPLGVWMRPDLRMSALSPAKPEHVSLQARALAQSAEACRRAYVGEGADTCTLARILPVASELYASALGAGDGKVPELPFDRVEQRIAALERELTSISRRVDDVDRHVKTLAEQRANEEWMRERLRKQDEEIRWLTMQMATFARDAYEENCKRPYQRALDARLGLAQALGFTSTCGAPAPTPAPRSLVSSPRYDIELDPFDLCQPELPMKLSVGVGFDACQVEIDCTKKGSSACPALDAIASKIDGSRLAAGSLVGGRRPFVVWGYASDKPVDKCAPIATAGLTEMATRKIAGLGPDRLQNGLGYLRARAMAKALVDRVFPGLSPTEADQRVENLFELVPAGTFGIKENCFLLNPTDHKAADACYDKYQRVSLELHLDQVRFPVERCVGKR